MSDIQGDRPEDQTPAVPSQSAAEAAAQTPAQPETSAPAAAAPEAVEPAQPAAPAQPAPPVTPAAAAAALPPVPPNATAAQSAAHVQPTAPTQPVPPAGYPAAAHAYARPQGYAGQPAPYPHSYAGQPAPGAPGAAFGVTAADAQPTLPIAGSTGAVPTATKAPRKSSGAGKVVGLIVAAAIVGGAAGLGGAYAGVTWFAPVSASPAAGPSTVTVNDTDSVNQTTAIAAKVVPSVVTIEATGSSAAGTGSGVVLTEDGYVVTNTHVVTLDGATGDATVRVTTSDGRVYDAEVVGTDPTYDLAVIKLKGAEDLTPIEIADSSKLNVGDTTVAVGAPLGLANSVTEGIVSALNRSISIASSAAPDAGGDSQDEQDQNSQEGPFRFDFGQGDQQSTATESISISVIQTDAAINPGNSGGALVDSDGKLIGINVAIATAGGSSSDGSGSIGVGFSIPSDIVKRITGEIIDNGEATHGLLGANVKAAASVEGSTITGAYIDAVTDGGAAAAAGLQKGDIVTAFNGVPVTDATDLTAQVRAAAAGSDAEVTYVRDGKTQTVQVTLGSLQQ
ncbi:putative serine protease PepD [Microbacterium trichothecenolyticum]|uniref:S1C family serine protease n=1 Tax=Microbacterium trichothecenolyticum TaxID=69370 RepID=UPI002864342E|nr:trypsin-like peptidase domain-containing protein [Microbacterium trichothecenolyticum]MDR7113950.1 putative serine protease PepD [Microbacterium trichothecenolyticum]